MPFVFTGTYSGHPFTLQLSISESATSIADNTSTLSWTLTTINVGGANPHVSDSSATYSVTINGNNYSGSWSPYTFSGTVGETIVMSGGHGLVVPHTSDGTKTITVSASADGKATINTASLSGSATLTKLPRNQLQVGVAGVWKTASVYVGVNGVWVPAVPYVGVAGVWKGIAH